MEAIIMNEYREEIQENICNNMVALISTAEDGQPEIKSWKCKYYGCNPPPCHQNIKSKTFIDRNDCKHRE
jgi:hypothetical protein